MFVMTELNAALAASSASIWSAPISHRRVSRRRWLKRQQDMTGMPKAA
jgi:hypothetical protein